MAIAAQAAGRTALSATQESEAGHVLFEVKVQTSSGRKEVEVRAQIPDRGRTGRGGGRGGKIVGVGPVEVPFGPFTNTIRIREFNPLDRDKDYKVHAPGTGIIVDGTLQLEDVNQTSGAAPRPTITRQMCGVA
jgi:hypothetical protein